MTIIEQRTMEIICNYLPSISESLEKIAEALGKKVSESNERDGNTIQHADR